MSQPIKPTKVLCKRTLTSGKSYWWDDTVSPPVRHEYDNRMLVADNWYDVIESKNDSWNAEKRQFTFTIIDNQKKPHLFFMYEEQDKKDWPDFCSLYGPRDYAKWFYTPEEIIALEKGEFKLLEDINVRPGNYYWVKSNSGPWMIALAVSKIEFYVIGSGAIRSDKDFFEIGEQVLSREEQLRDKKKQKEADDLIDEVTTLIDAINKPDPDQEYPPVEYVMPYVNKAISKYFDASFEDLADFFETDPDEKKANGKNI